MIVPMRTAGIDNQKVITSSYIMVRNSKPFQALIQKIGRTISIKAANSLCVNLCSHIALSVDETFIKI